MKAAAALDRVRIFERYQYLDPRQLLIDLARIEGRMDPDLPYKVRSMRTNNLKREREGRAAALFCYGMSAAGGYPKVHFANEEGQDYDAVASWVDGDLLRFAPLQIKELVPAILNPHASLQEEVNKLPARYPDSKDLTVVMYVNKDCQFSPPDLKMPEGLCVASLWVLAALRPDRSEWATLGKLSGKVARREILISEPGPPTHLDHSLLPFAVADRGLLQSTATNAGRSARKGA